MYRGGASGEIYWNTAGAYGPPPSFFPGCLAEQGRKATPCRRALSRQSRDQSYNNMTAPLSGGRPTWREKNGERSVTAKKQELRPSETPHLAVPRPIQRRSGTIFYEIRRTRKPAEFFNTIGRMRTGQKGRKIDLRCIQILSLLPATRYGSTNLKAWSCLVREINQSTLLPQLRTYGCVSKACWVEPPAFPPRRHFQTHVRWFLSDMRQRSRAPRPAFALRT